MRHFPLRPNTRTRCFYVQHLQALRQNSRHAGVTGACRSKNSQVAVVLAFLSRRQVSTHRDSFTEKAFTLVELLVVMGIIIIMAALVMPAFNSLGGSKNFTSEAYDISGMIDEARAFAISNNTYVYLGFAEFDASKPSNATPQVSGTGRVVVAAVATIDGLRDYDPSNAALTWSQKYGSNGANLMAPGRLRTFENIHMADSLGTVPTSGEMVRQSADDQHRVGTAKFASLTPFSWPLGTALKSGQYNFTKVICFNPQGSPLLEYKNSSPIYQWLEIGLQPTHGNITPPQPTNANVGNQIAIVINGVTGGTQIYRP